MTLSLSASTKAARSTAVASTIDAAIPPGEIKLYTASRPANGASPGSAVLLATLVLTDPCGTVDAVGLHLSAAAPAQAVAAGIVTWARVTDGDDGFVMDGDVRMTSDVDSGIADFIIDVSQLYTGSFVNLVAAVLTEAG